jgi:hypothetical protein
MLSINKAKKYTKHVPEDVVFVTISGKRIRNMYELYDVFINLNDSEFKHHVNENKNDFKNWIFHIVKDIDLASEIATLKTKSDMLSAIESRINIYKTALNISKKERTKKVVQKKIVENKVKKVKRENKRVDLKKKSSVKVSPKKHESKLIENKIVKHNDNNSSKIKLNMSTKSSKLIKSTKPIKSNKKSKSIKKIKSNKSNKSNKLNKSFKPTKFSKAKKVNKSSKLSKSKKSNKSNTIKKDIKIVPLQTYVKSNNITTLKDNVRLNSISEKEKDALHVISNVNYRLSREEFDNYKRLVHKEKIRLFILGLVFGMLLGLIWYKIFY